MESIMKKSILCPNCRKLISRDEQNCPYCHTARPGSWWMNNPWTRSQGGSDSVIMWIIYLNVGMFIIALLLRPKGANFSMSPFAFLSPDNRSLLMLGASGTVPVERLHRWWSIVSANYLHGSLMHILFNMIALKQIGTLIIKEYGTFRMLAIYAISGAIGFLVSILAGVGFTVGASAAVCGMIGAGIYYGKSRGGNYGQEIYRQIGGWALMIFVFGLLVPGINNWGHGGGMVGGVLFGYLLGYNEKSRENYFHKVLAGSCLAITIVILAYAVLSSIYYAVG
ncbi:MAG: rhomboid family intramembrane serine protease [Proteobacteria bacterium]|nr:rhomboid family intramembrane serine protease [Pseudomonadota bacterium]MBU1716547.1 rhomboid family intramembrane serine protease [Pseudomonadota bacterium]